MIKSLRMNQIFDKYTIEKYASMKPVSCCINDVSLKVLGWTDLYIQIVRLLANEYPFTFTSLSKKGRGFDSDEVMDIGNHELCHKMKRPVEITPNIFLETNLIPSQIFKNITSLCRDHYVQLVIDFLPEEVAIDKPVQTRLKKQDILLKTDSDHTKLSETEKKAQKTGAYAVDKSIKYMEVTLDELEKQAGTKPVSFSIDGAEKKEVRCWSDLHLQLVQCLMINNVDYLRSKVPRRFKDNPERCLGNYKTYKDMERPYKVDKNLYLDLSSSPIIIKKCISSLFEDYSKIRIRLVYARMNSLQTIPLRTITLKGLNSLSSETKKVFFRKCTPVAFRMDNTPQFEYSLGRTSSWKNLYLKIHYLVEGLSPITYDQLVGVCFDQDENISIGYLNNYQEMREPVLTPQNHLVEIGITYTQILDGLVKLFETCNLAPRDLLIDCVMSQYAEVFFSKRPSERDQSKSNPPTEKSSFLPDSNGLNSESLIVDSLIRTSDEDYSDFNNTKDKNNDQEDIEKEDSLMIKRIAFNYLNLYTNWKPYLLQVEHQKIEVQSWQTLEIQIAKQLALSKPKTLHWIAAKEEAAKRFRLALTESKNKLSSPVQIMEDIYVNIGNSPEECLEILNTLILELGFKTDNISVHLKGPLTTQTRNKGVSTEAETLEAEKTSIFDKSKYSISEISLEKIGNKDLLASLRRRRLSLIDISWNKIPVAFQLRDQDYLALGWRNLQQKVFKVLLQINPLLLDVLECLEESDLNILGLTRIKDSQEEQYLEISDSESQCGLYLKCETNSELIIKSIKNLFHRAQLEKSSLLIYCVNTEKEVDKFSRAIKEQQKLSKETETSQTKTEVLELDIIEKDDYEKTTPLSFELKGVTHTVDNWDDLYLSSFKKLIGYNPSFLKEKRNISFIEEREWDLADESGRNKLKKPVEIASQIYLETDLTKTGIIRRLQTLIPECNIDFEDYSIKVTSYENSGTNEDREEISDSETLVAVNSASVSGIQSVKTSEENDEPVSLEIESDSKDIPIKKTENESSDLSDKEVQKSSSFQPDISLGDHQQDQRPTEKEETDEGFREENSENQEFLIQHGKPSVVPELAGEEDNKPRIDSRITQYYLEESQIEEEQTSSNTTTLNQEMNCYILWMIQNGALNQEIHKNQFYFGILSQFLLDHGYTDENLVCIKDTETLKIIKDKLYSQPDFQKFNYHNYNRPRQVLNDFIDYRSYS